MEDAAMPTEYFHQIFYFSVNSELNSLTTFSLLPLEGRILPSDTLVQSRGSYLAHTSTPPPRASLRPAARASPESIGGAVPAPSKELKTQP